ncbi:MAG: tetratricopeptide repeat protein [Planctomycetes bacterium]|nr:tetratricopeptide repeat protein [Planctomycetota bacterium]
MRASHGSIAAAALAISISLAAQFSLRTDAGSARQPAASGRALLSQARALMERGRLDQDHAAYVDAEAAARAALQLDPQSYEARAYLSVILAGEHRFEEAIEEAKRALAISPDSALPHGVLTDAFVELGRYEEALASCQAMLDVRPSPGALARAAYLHSLHGDGEGAAELLRDASAGTARGDERAWFLTQLATEQLGIGELAEARASVDHALALAPNAKPARILSARIHWAAGDQAAAQRELAPLADGAGDPDALALLGAMSLAEGKLDEARPRLEAARRLEQAELDAGGNELHHLVELLLMVPGATTEALALAERDANRRRDIQTLDRLARAQFFAGRAEEARISMAQALRTGSRDPRLLVHSAEIEAACGNPAVAREQLRAALERRAALPPTDLARAVALDARLRRTG